MDLKERELDSSGSGYGPMTALVNKVINLLVA
jgi:hypothetical protein